MRHRHDNETAENPSFLVGGLRPKKAALKTTITTTATTTTPSTTTIPQRFADLNDPMAVNQLLSVEKVLKETIGTIE